MIALDCRDNLGKFEIIAEETFGDITATWINYLCPSKTLKNKGGCYVTLLYDNSTGEELTREYYKNDYVREHCFNKLLDKYL